MEYSNYVMEVFEDNKSAPEKFRVMAIFFQLYI